MNFRHLFENNKAVSPVIGVVLMVAITVILAAAIGSSVFGEGTSEPAPQAHLNIKAVSPYDGSSAVVTLEHLGGDPINFDSNSTTKVMVAIGTTSTEVNATGLGILNVGDTASLNLNNTDGTTAITSATSGTTVNFKFIDVATSQLIVDKDVRF
ncbi:MAG: type IV pilin [Methanosarcinaceae archaeon]|nr:type IV pilin [Methanosarcinaceae archaeon]